jgi:hypothetical protein
VSAGEWAGLIAALAAVVLVLLLAIPLLKLGRFLDEATLAVRRSGEQVTPILLRADTPVTQVDGDLERVDDVPGTAAHDSGTAAEAAPGTVVELSDVVAATLGGPLIKVAAYSYGVRSAVRRKREDAALAELQRRGRGGRRNSRPVRRAA